MKYLGLILVVSTLTACVDDNKNQYDYIVKAHSQYIKAKIDGHKGNRSTYLPNSPNGKTKGDEYNYCVQQGWYKSVHGIVEGVPEYPDFHTRDFCNWHAEIGLWQYSDPKEECKKLYSDKENIKTCVWLKENN